MRKGFTLAEVLITLAVIGIVAALAIPALMQNTNNTQFKAAWKKAFADLSQAAKRISIDNAGNLTQVFITPDILRNKFIEYMNYTKTCDVGAATGSNGCWHAANSWYKLSGGIRTEDWSDQSRVTLNNGSLISFKLLSADCNNVYTPNDDNCGDITVDVNGFKGPNTIGKDIFAARILKNGSMIPVGTEGDYNSTQIISQCDRSVQDTIGWNCSAEYIKN